MINSTYKKKEGPYIKTPWPKNKKIIYIIAGLLVLGAVAIGVYLANKKADQKVMEQKQKQKIEEARAQRMGAAAWSRVSFFESLPINVTLAVPSYLEGNYRMAKGADNVSFSYIKNPEIVAPMLDIKVAKRDKFKLGEGETELKSDCPDYKFSYKLYPSDSYTGEDKEGFAQAIYDFSFFLAGEGYFKCFPR